ncbi:MAG: hypothetical protein QNJ54_35185 [Prochloraceae cyanobacterium]|nr:hypothetical protein [Prochloraceae cyanobacterium]
MSPNTSDNSEEMFLYDCIIFNVPPTIKILYFWLLSRAEPGEIQEFDKEDFDDYCIRMGRSKGYSVQWFTTCLKKLEETPLLIILRRYRGYGYKVKVYPPKKLSDLSKLMKTNI